MVYTLLLMFSKRDVVFKHRHIQEIEREVFRVPEHSLEATVKRKVYNNCAIAIYLQVISSTL